MSAKLDSLGVVVAGPINKFFSAFVANLHVVEHRVGLAEILRDDFAIGRENDDAFVRTDIDVATLVDRNPAVRRPESRLAIRPQTPAGNGIKGHDPAAHAYGPGGFCREGGEC